MKSLIPSYALPVLIIEIKRLFAYRLDFWLRLGCTTFARVVFGYYLWSAIFASSTSSSFGGFTLSGMIIYYVLASVCVSGVVIFGGFISREIYDGSHTRFIVYPVSFLYFKYCTALAQQFFCLIQLFIALGLCYLIVGETQGVHFSFINLVLGSFSVLIGGALYFSLAINIESLAFWIERTFSISLSLFLMTNILGGIVLPLTLFPTWAQTLLHYSPFPYFVYVPVQAFLGAYSISLWLNAALIALAWIVLLQIFGRALFKLGSKQYTGIGQ